MSATRLKGLIAATYTPLHEDGSLNLDQVAPIVDHLLADGIDGLYVCGSTGEGMSLTGDERRAVAEAYATATDGRVPIVVQVGHNSIAEACELARHAEKIGAAAVSATCPSYYKIGDVPMLVDCMREIAAAASDVPFYYYHIPALTGTPLNMVDFLQQGAERIPTLVGLKYTAPTLHEFQHCMQLDGGRFDIVWGVDEMLLAGLATGARGAIGSTYNIAAPLYRRITSAFERNDMDEARRLQALSVVMIDTIAQYPFHPAMKRILGMIGLECGPCRRPLPAVPEEESRRLHGQLTVLGFFDWRSATAGASAVPPPKMASIRQATPRAPHFKREESGT